MLVRAVIALSLASLVACAASTTSDSADADTDALSDARRVSGFDLDGPKVLVAGASAVELCPAGLSLEAEACERAQGMTVRADGCKVLCSKPIAPGGKSAGYDFIGFKQLAADRVASESCRLANENDVAAACARAGGVLASANECTLLCSRPIAAVGNVAGYDVAGAFRVAPSDRVANEFCASGPSAAASERCVRTGGTTSRINGCAEVCSLPP